MSVTILLSSAATAQSYLNETGEPCPEGFVAAGDYCYTPEAYEIIQSGAGTCEGTPTDEEFLACLESETGSTPTTVEDPAATSVSCSGFASQFGAQQYYDYNATPEEQALLDPDGDGFACSASEADAATAEEYSTGNADTGGLTASQMYPVLPDTGGPALLVPLGLLLCGAGFVLGRRLL